MKHRIHMTSEEIGAENSEQTKELLSQILTKLDNKGVQTVKIDGVETIAIKGDKGDQGDIGPQGPAGQDGRSMIGPKGPRGDKGVKGDQGNPGNDGKSIVGPQGLHGKDGSPDTPEEIISKINSSKKKIESKRIAGLDDIINSVDQIVKWPQGKTGGGFKYKFYDDGVKLADFITEINFGSGLSTSLSNGRLTITSVGGSGANVATEKLTPTVSGADITLDLSSLSQTFDTIQWVAKNGQILDSSDATFGWSRVTTTITVLNATTTDIFLVHYTYL